MALFEESPVMLDEEHILIMSAQKGDRQAFAVLVERYWDRLYRWLYHLTHHRQTAEDLALPDPRVTGVGDRDGLALGEREHATGEYEAHGQGFDQGGHPQLRDADAVDQPDERTEQQHDHDGGWAGYVVLEQDANYLTAVSALVIDSW